MANTRISYMYRDADNYKAWNHCIIEGTLTDTQKEEILSCLECGEYFIPSQVGLPEKRFDDGITEADHCWFEVDGSCFNQTDAEPTVNLTANALVSAFRSKKGRWDDSKFPVVV